MYSVRARVCVYIYEIWYVCMYGILAGEAKNGNGRGFSSSSPWTPDVAVVEGKVCTVKETRSHLWDEGGILRGWNGGMLPHHLLSATPSKVTYVYFESVYVYASVQ